MINIFKTVYLSRKTLIDKKRFYTTSKSLDELVKKIDENNRRRSVRNIHYVTIFMALSRMTLSRLTHSRMTPRRMTQSRMPLSGMALNEMTRNIT